MYASVFKAIMDLETFYLEEFPTKVLNRLASFIESGSFRKSEFDKFICKNFRLSYKEIICRWNCIHSEDSKVENTARGTKSLINSYLVQLLDIDLSTFSKMFVLNDEEALTQLVRKILVLEKEEFVPCRRFSFNIFEAMQEIHSNEEYAIEDCVAELEFLKAIDYTSIYTQLQKLNENKLRYLLSVLQEPLIHKRRINMKTIPELNASKVDVCMGLLQCRGRTQTSDGFSFDGKEF